MTTEGTIIVKIIRPDQPEPIPARRAEHPIGKIAVRFIILLVIVIALMVFAWLR